MLNLIYEINNKNGLICIHQIPFSLHLSNINELLDISNRES